MSLSVLLQRLTPLTFVSRCAGRLGASRRRWIAQPLIRLFIKRYGIDMREAALTQPGDYASFNAFFSRALHPQARPPAKADCISPVDGRISQRGHIDGEQLIQAKQQTYSAAELLGDARLARRLSGGHFLTLYLSPGDYHRVHLPCPAQLVAMRHVPGRRFSVRPEIVQRVDGLLARNERRVCHFRHPVWGEFAMVLVGAAMVGSIVTRWDDALPRALRHGRWQWRAPQAGQAPHWLPAGADIGHFKMGSSVVLLLPATAGPLAAAWRPGAAVRCGQALSDAMFALELPPSMPEAGA